MIPFNKSYNAGHVDLNKINLKGSLVEKIKEVFTG